MKPGSTAANRVVDIGFTDPLSAPAPERRRHSHNNLTACIMGQQHRRDGDAASTHRSAPMYTGKKHCTKRQHLIRSTARRHWQCAVVCGRGRRDMHLPCTFPAAAPPGVVRNNKAQCKVSRNTAKRGTAANRGRMVDMCDNVIHGMGRPRWPARSSCRVRRWCAHAAANQVLFTTHLGVQKSLYATPQPCRSLTLGPRP